MGIGGLGALNADDAGLRSDFDPNTGMGRSRDRWRRPAAAAPGAVNGLMGGSTLTGEMDGIDAASVGDIACPPPAGWVMKTLFRDWGDTVGRRRRRLRDWPRSWSRTWAAPDDPSVECNAGRQVRHPMTQHVRRTAAGPQRMASPLTLTTPWHMDVGCVHRLNAGAHRRQSPPTRRLDAGATGTAALAAIVGPRHGRLNHKSYGHVSRGATAHTLAAGTTIAPISLTTHHRTARRPTRSAMAIGSSRPTPAR